MEATLVWTGDGVRFAAETTRGPVTPVGSEEDTTSPMALLLEAVAGCFSIDAIGILQKQRVGLLEYRVAAHGERVDDGRAKPYSEIVLTVSVVTEQALTREQSDRVVELGLEYCSVSKSLKAPVRVRIEASVRDTMTRLDS